MGEVREKSESLQWRWGPIPTLPAGAWLMLGGQGNQPADFPAFAVVGKSRFSPWTQWYLIVSFTEPEVPEVWTEATIDDIKTNGTRCRVWNENQLPEFRTLVAYHDLHGLPGWITVSEDGELERWENCRVLAPNAKQQRTTPDTPVSIGVKVMT